MKHTDFPKLRPELEFVDGKNGNIVTVVDPYGYVRPDLALDWSFAEIFSLLDGTHSIHDIAMYLSSVSGESITTNQCRQLLSFLDEELLLDSQYFANAMAFLQAKTVGPSCAGTVYPNKPEALRAYLDNILTSYPSPLQGQLVWAALIPHIDFRVAAQHYGSPFNALRTAEFDLLVHIGTSHYGWQDRFLLTTKNFITPLGEIKTDHEIVEQIRQELCLPLTRNDLAYKNEHALELHHVFIQYLFPDRDYTVISILVPSFHDFVVSGQHPSTDTKFLEFCQVLRRVIERSRRTPLVLISGDLSHVGRRFGDKWDAASMLDTIRLEDMRLLTTIARGSSHALFSTISSTCDRRRICGFPPLMTFQETFSPGEGVVLDYGQWNDLQTQSAVSFGSIVWFR